MFLFHQAFGDAAGSFPVFQSGFLCDRFLLGYVPPPCGLMVGQTKATAFWLGRAANRRTKFVARTPMGRSFALWGSSFCAALIRGNLPFVIVVASGLFSGNDRSAPASSSWPGLQIDSHCHSPLVIQRCACGRGAS